MTKEFRIKNLELRIIVFLICILAAASFLRLYALDKVPPSASLDEASIGWNAYSIIKTGGDEYGNKSPLLLRAYDDWRPALYVYLVAPFVQIIGLDVLAVRLPSVILSVLTVIATYFLVKELFGRRETKRNPSTNPSATSGSTGSPSRAQSRDSGPSGSGQTRINAEIIALSSAFLLAISPWHIYISRLGHEANLAFSLGIFAIFFFLKFTNTFKNIYIYLSSVFFALSFYAYQAEKIFVPLIVVILTFLFRRELLKRKKQVIIAAVLGFAIFVPVLNETLSPNGLIRLSGTSAFDINQSVYIQAAEDRLSAKEDGDLFSELIDNNRIISLRIFAGNYISHFSPTWLFENNSIDDFKAPNVGLLYIWELPFILIGLFFLFSRQFGNRSKVILLAWIIISPVAASIATGAPHAMRSYNFLPTFQILTGLGAFFIYSILKKEILKKIFILFFVLLAGAFTIYFSKQYFFIFPKEQSASFQLALARSIPFVLENEGEYNKIVFSNQDSLYQSYMFFLFYSKYDPRLYQKQGGTKSGGFAETHTFGKYEFRPIKWDKENKDQNILYVGNREDFPQKAKTIKTVDFLNGELGIKIVKGD